MGLQDRLAHTVVIETPQGQLRGSSEAGIVSFKGVRYAAPPFGAPRLEAPRPAEHWDGVRDAVDYGPTAPHPGYAPPYDDLFPDPVLAGEDCLTSTSGRPIPAAAGCRSWCGSTAGRSSTARAPCPLRRHAFARDGVVLVTSTTGSARGFPVPRGRRADNRGLLDQLAALEWVQREHRRVRRRPGQRHRVRRVGRRHERRRAPRHAARGGTVPARDPAERRGHHGSHRPLRGRVAEASPGASASRPGRRRSRSPGSPSCARPRPSSALEITMNPDPGAGGVAVDVMAFEPTIDGDVLPVLPFAAVEGGTGRRSTLLTGTTTEEWRLFVVPHGPHRLPQRRARGAAAGRLRRRRIPRWPLRMPARTVPPETGCARSPPTGSCGSRRSGWRRPRRRPRADLSLRAGLALAAVRRPAGRVPRARHPVRLRHPGHRRGPCRLRATRPRSRSPTPCARRGSPSRVTATPAGRPTTPRSARSWSSMRPRRS